MQSAAMYKLSKTRSKAKDLDPVSSGKFLTKCSIVAKTSVPAIIGGPEIILYSSDKAKLFVISFAATAALADKSQPLPDFSPLTHKLCNISITSREVSRLIKNFDLKKSTGWDKITLVDLKNIISDLSLILLKLFNR